MSEWTLIVSAPDAWLTANKPKSWRQRSILASAWRRATYQTAQAAKLPTGLARVRIEPVARFIAGRAPVRDIPNLAPTIKAAVDGLGPPDRGRTAAGTPWVAPGYGLVPDDDDEHVELAQTVVGEPLPRRAYGPLGQLVLRIVDLGDAGRAVRGLCPQCGRDVAVLADGTVARWHLTPDGKRCRDGYGRKALPQGGASEPNKPKERSS